MLSLANIPPFLKRPNVNKIVWVDETRKKCSGLCQYVCDTIEQNCANQVPLSIKRTGGHNIVFQDHPKESNSQF